ncbi:waprin-Phi1-like [Cyprinus carpio]|uniref:Waprin-Phi1-like n=1 Tax=Cyprinus carpio TaxID=7962 RepID=A0A9Q9Y475_CYPCA|nr:waprin-Phi1-like [Cyprinus carpio]
MNARVCCSLIAVLLCFSVCLSTTDAKKHAKVKRNVRLFPAKPGVCPDDKDMIGTCVEDCFGDSECPDDEKCCSNGCGHVCMHPYKAEKPGSCPKPVGFGLCAEMCSGDSNCPNNQKCCSNGCGHQCMAPYKEKPGVCPKISLEDDMLGVCAELCSQDGHCPMMRNAAAGCGLSVWPI